ncbi:MAG: hypothetical protein Q8R30_05405 [bacterium]|nr:hypothetical protein [bacterium]
MTAEKSPILVLPEDKMRVEQLRKKLEEYKQRADPYRAPELQMGTVCKTAILERLLRDMVVDTWQLCLEMKETYGSGFDPQKFGVACGVIADYCNTGGRNTTGGTGLSV